jgi:predicted metalloprotease with PDZ domain
MRRILRQGAMVLVVAGAADAQTPTGHFTDGVDVRMARGQPVIQYTLTVAEGDTAGYDVRMSIRGAPDTFRIAMARHPEYDDKFFRHVENVRADARATLAREDSARWRVVVPGGEAVIDYRIALPPRERTRPAWVPFLAPTGGLVGGPHSFMYIVGQELAPAHVEVRAPWPKISTGLTPTAATNVFFASNAYVLVESPILAGDLRQWTFQVDGVPHVFTWWGRAGNPAFDTTALRSAVEKLVTQAVALFGRAPYREYHFQFQDDAWGGLEHHNSVTLGANSERLRSDPVDVLPEVAHEFIHTWNLMRIRPAEYVGVTYRQIRPVPILWFSEGLTIFYADLLTRRAALPTDEATRIDRAASVLGRYLSMPGNTRFSAEQVSRVEYNARPDALGDNDASSHVMGEAIGTMLDLMIRDATDGRRSMDDVMRQLFERSSAAGVRGTDVERTVASVCGCAVAPFFAAHVRGTTGAVLDFNKYLGLVGLKATVSGDTVRRDGVLDPDRRIWAWNPPGDTLLALLVNNPATVYGRAGLHSGDKLISVNGTTVRTWNELRAQIVQWRVGDDVHFAIQDRSSGVTRNVPVKISGYDRPVVRITELPDATPKQLRLREAWLAGR